jgi:hypothetical protein
MSSVKFPQWLLVFRAIRFKSGLLLAEGMREPHDVLGPLCSQFEEVLMTQSILGVQGGGDMTWQ